MKKMQKMEFMNKLNEIEYKAEVVKNEDKKSITLHGPVAMSESTWNDKQDGYINPTTLSKLLDECDGEDIDVHVNTYGGDVFGGIACYNVLKAYKGKVNIIIDGMSASAGTLIALAGDTVQMYKASQQMFHNAWTFAMGNKNDIQKVLNSLEKIETSMMEIYMDRFNGTQEELQAILDDETFLTASECLAYNLIDEIIDANEEDDTEDVENSITEVYANMYFNRFNNEVKPEETKTEEPDKKTPENANAQKGVFSYMKFKK